MDAFISYRRKTGGIYALEIYKFLKDNCGMNVFYDREGLYAESGKFFPIIEESILKADNFILILTDFEIDDLETNIYIKEIETALDNKKNIIVTYANQFNSFDKLPPKLKELEKRQRMDISDPFYFKSEFRSALLAKMLPSEKRDRMYNKLSFVSKLESRAIIEHRLSLADRLEENTISVDMAAIACYGFICNKRENIETLAKNGCRFRFIINNPDSTAAVDAYTKKIKGGSERQRSRIIKHSYESLQDWRDYFPEMIQGKTTDEFLPCSIFIIRNKDPEKDSIKVDYYSLNRYDNERRSVFITRKDEENFNFYLEEFEYLWKISKDIQ